VSSIANFPRTRKLGLVKRTMSSKDGDGNNVYTDSITVVDGSFAPGGTSENNDGESQVVDAPAVYVRQALNTGPLDAVIVDIVRAVNGDVLAGTKYEVDGKPEAWPMPLSDGIGTVIKLKRVTG
jgi:hypothetical protein